MLDKETIKQIALANGFKLKEQANGEMDLNPYVYDALNKVAEHCWSARQSGVMPHKIHPTKASPNNGWISVDNPPEKDGEYLVYGFDDFENCHKQKLEYFIAKDKSFITDLSFVITHWQPKPEPPKEQEMPQQIKAGDYVYIPSESLKPIKCFYDEDNECLRINFDDINAHVWFDENGCLIGKLDKTNIPLLWLATPANKAKIELFYGCELENPPTFRMATLTIPHDNS